MPMFIWFLWCRISCRLWVAPTGQVLCADAQAANLFGTAPDAMVGRQLADAVMDPDVVAEVLDR